jgi:spore germination protein AB
LFTPTVDQDKKVGPYLVFFLITSVQIGVGILSFQTAIIKYAEYDAWISVIITGLVVNLVIFLLYKMLLLSNGDLVSIHNELFGKWLGGFLNTCFIMYFTMTGLTVIRSFIEVIQTWMFPTLSVWGFNLALLPLIYYIVSGGFRTVVGICFFGTVLPAYLLLIFLFPLEYGELGNLLPVFDHSIVEILKSSREMVISYLGFSTLLVYFPYIQEQKKSQKWAQFGAGITILIYLFITVISFAYFNLNQIKDSIWPTLALWKIIELPFVERFEYIGLSSWLIVVMPNICLFVWCASRLGVRTYKISKSKWVYIILFIYFIGCIFLNDHEKITKYGKIISETGFYLAFVYLPFLACLYIIVKKLRNKK